MLARLRSVVRPVSSVFRPTFIRPLMPASRMSGLIARPFSTTFLERTDVESRILKVVKTFPKVNAAHISPSASFTKDLGLDSLDEVEVVIACEDEFGIEIPDAEFEKIHTVSDAVNFITGHPQAK